MSPSGNTDPQLIARFEKIYAGTYYKLYGFAKRYLKDPAAIKDVLQDCYIRLWEKLNIINDDEHILPMLRTWVMNTTINALRKNASDKARNSTWQTKQEQVFRETDNLFANETLQPYYKAIAELPHQQRLVFSLTKEEGLSQQETADRLQISIHTVKRHLSEAINTLRTKIPDTTFTGILLVSELYWRNNG